MTLIERGDYPTLSDLSQQVSKRHQEWEGGSHPHAGCRRFAQGRQQSSEKEEGTGVA